MDQIEEVIELEDKDTETGPVRPWDPKLIRITTKNFTIREIYSQLVEGELDLAPDFQRSYVWKSNQQVRLIESILLGIPLPAFYFNQDILGELQVIDGVQRLTTIRLFMEDRIDLSEKHLEYLFPLKGSTYSSLDAATRRRFAGTQIVAHVIEPQTPDDVKYDIFNRVNTGGSPLTAQEIRHCMSKAKSRKFLTLLAQSRGFDEATDWAFWKKDASGTDVRDSQRMSNREMALRFCAFVDISFSDYAKSNSLDAFLLNFTRRIDQGDDHIDLDLLKDLFNTAMRNAAIVFGNGAFRRWPVGASRRGPINRAVFESQAVALSDWDTGFVTENKEKFREVLRELFSDPNYDNAVRQGTGDIKKLERRLSAPRDALNSMFE